ncbi:nocardicin N-oxygenase [Streptomyces olivoverticillatus]|uniref:Nocardicin N-oxygenase n=1 Tax=Streptomyces olivoverticillatus TaxID=66427 RepID=A0A7W7LT15_9ACTN|nr:cytochrome P450 [Streptomyces olivoverticillatus]MBB4895201.1 nocardicin N-oxygenase [Streptomyces olivoverticillatus]
MTTEEAPPFPFPTDRPWEPAREFAALRALDGIRRVRLPTGDRAWLVTRYEDNRRVLSDPRFSRAAAARAGAPRARRAPLEARSLTTMDPPEHTRLRRVAMRAFTTRRVQALRPGIQRTTDRLLDGLAAAGPGADLVAGLARPLPVAVICQLLGVPAGDHERFGAWTRVYLSVDGRSAEEIEAAAASLKGYLAGLIAEKRRRPTDDLLADLACAPEEERLDEEELLTFGVTLLVAGVETVAHEISGSVLALLRHRDQWELLQKPGVLEKAVEELIRYTPAAVSGGTVRIALEDVELGGVLVRAGEAVLPAVISADRDAAVFDGPDRLDVTRDPNPHIGFGHGPHRCLGAQLARAELGIAVGSLAARFPGLRPAVDVEELEWDLRTMQRGPRALPVVW